MKERIRKPTVEKRKGNKWVIPLIALTLILASSGVTADEDTCDEIFQMIGAWEEGDCDSASLQVDGGCWYDPKAVIYGGTHCWNCDGSDPKHPEPVTECEHYIKRECTRNPCKLAGGCTLDGGNCKKAGASTETCSELCGGLCTSGDCDVASVLSEDDCWHEQVGGTVVPDNCWNCDGRDSSGSKTINACGDYTQQGACIANHCIDRIGHDCGWDGTTCIKAGSSELSCSEICGGSLCDKDKCDGASQSVSTHCWFEIDGGVLIPDHCWSCDGSDSGGSKTINACGDYTQQGACIANHCIDRIGGHECSWDKTKNPAECVEKGTSTGTCNELCKSFSITGLTCSPEGCRDASDAAGGCWFEEGAAIAWPDNCWRCDGSEGENKGLGSCGGYGPFDCPKNPCGVNLPDGCEWNEGCVEVGAGPYKPPGGLEIKKCTCTCKEEEITAHGATTEGCAEACGGMCGGSADYEEDLDEDCSNCEDFCSNNLVCPAHQVECKKGCVTACESVCSLNETLYGLVDIIYYVAGIIAAIMFIIQGYKFIVSTTPEERDEAKKAIMYIILAMILIGIAGTLVKTFLGTVSLGGEEPPAPITTSTSTTSSSSIPLPPPSCSSMGTKEACENSAEIECWWKEATLANGGDKCEACAGVIGKCDDYHAIGKQLDEDLCFRDPCGAGPCHYTFPVGQCKSCSDSTNLQCSEYNCQSCEANPCGVQSGCETYQASPLDCKCRSKQTISRTNEYHPGTTPSCAEGSKTAWCGFPDDCVSCSGNCWNSGVVLGPGFSEPYRWMCYEGKWDYCDASKDGSTHGSWTCDGSTGKWTK
ncbi:MAG: pilin [Candidatus Altiarchaeota archaeon]|nr:pilin [Candidatus Altiarchaeota archaeon]